MFLNLDKPLTILILSIISVEPLKESMKSGDAKQYTRARHRKAFHAYTRTYTHIRIGQQSGHQKQPPTRTLDGMFQRITCFPRFQPIPFAENIYHAQREKVLLLRGRTPYRGHGVRDIEKSIYIP